MFTDSHAHLTSDEVYPVIDSVLERAKKCAIENIINICTDKKTLERGFLLHDKEPCVFNAGSTTPHDVEKEGALYFPLFEEAARSGKLVAVGETGLDYFYTHSNKQVQKEFFIKYCKLALDTNLPLIIHCRDAFADFFDITEKHYKTDGEFAPLVLHCFTGSLADAKKIVDRGWYVSFSGIVTFKKSIELQEVAKQIPLDHIFIETDSPYLAPRSKRGKQNEPSYVVETAAMIAELKGISVEEIGLVTTANAKKFFGI